MKQFFVDKTSDTSADTLLAVGFAWLLDRVLYTLRKPRDGIVIRDVGMCYQIEIPGELTDLDREQMPPFTLVSPLINETKEEQKEEHQQRFDGFLYQQHQEAARLYYEARKQRPAHERTPDAQLQAILEERAAGPDPRLVHYQAITQMKIASSFNELATRWQALETLQREHIWLLLELFRQPGNDIAGAIATWQHLAKTHGISGKAMVTQLQIVNPTSGKGAYRAKANTLAEGNPDGFWLLELLKFAGFFFVAAPFVIRGSKDRKCYILQPRTIELSALERMMRAFRAVCWASTAVKLDILAVLRFAQVFVRLRTQALSQPDPFFAEQALENIAQGFEVVSYKDMGSAFATINIATMSLPQWLPAIETMEDAELAERVLQEHVGLIQQIRRKKDEEGAEEYALLRAYRSFLSGRDLSPFWEFTTGYSRYLISQRDHEPDFRRWLRQFSTQGLEHLLLMSTTKPSLLTITQNAGFQSIARAIRQATVNAQYRRSQKGDRTYDVYYGLGQELMRETRNEEKFLVALSHFLQKYNAETAREAEKLANRGNGTPDYSKLRMPVPYTAIDDLMTLLGTFDAEMVCALLVAYGYASEPFRKASTNVPAESTNPDVTTEEEL